MNNPILIPIVCLLIYPPSGAYAQAPGGVSTNLKLWVKAESALPTAGGNLTSWPDQTGANTFTRSGTASTLTTVNYTINFHPVVRFTGSAILIGNTSGRQNWQPLRRIHQKSYRYEWHSTDRRPLHQ